MHNATGNIFPCRQNVLQFCSHVFRADKMHEKKSYKKQRETVIVIRVYLGCGTSVVIQYMSTK